MKRLKLFIIVFCLAMALPLAYVAWRTYAGLAQEERSQLNYFSEALFDDMEKGLADLIQTEENRSVDEYHHTISADGPSPNLSPLARMPSQSYILGYFQNNPDGSFQTPLVADLRRVPGDRREVVALLTDINRTFNRKKFSIPRAITLDEETSTTPEILAEKKKSPAGLADRYLSRSVQKSSKAYLGQKEVRTEEITAQQALNLVPTDSQREAPVSNAPLSPADTARSERGRGDNPAVVAAGNAVAEDSAPKGEKDASRRFQVEVAPFQSVFVTPQHVFIFRRVAISDRIYRQGFVLDVHAFIDRMIVSRFRSQPISEFTSLGVRILDNDQKPRFIRNGPAVDTPSFASQRRFPAPFDFCVATLSTDTIPGSPARRPLNAAMAILGGVMLLGLLAIYHSARTIATMSERRAQFVSSVTHELKTPLTNIRMYIEMIEQGIAATPEREQEYLQVLNAESVRLSRLINNVLELAKLEKKQRRFRYQEGNLDDVFSDVRLVMSQKLRKEGFTLGIDAPQVPVFSYDREVLVQLLVNLIENSVKFGSRSPEKRIVIFARGEDDTIRIGVTDTGPGIPKRALKKIFNDFYRVDNELSRTTGGTGIGLALVNRFVGAMGGHIQAANNTGPGCTITISLPLRPV